MKKNWLSAALIAALVAVGGGVRADVVYSTGSSITAANFNLTQGGNNSSNNLNTATNPNTSGYGTGTMTATGGGTAWTTDNAIVAYDQGGANNIFIRFQTGGTLSTQYSLKALNWNGFLDGMTGSAPQITANSGGTAQWLLFEGTNTTPNVTVLNQSLSSGMVAPGGNSKGTVIYQSGNFDSNLTLTGATTYTLLLNSVAGMNLTTDGSATANNAFELHFNYFNAAGTGQVSTSGYTLTRAGTLGGAYDSALTGSTSRNLAFDLQVTVVPEPGTMAFGAIASLAGVGGWWSRRKKDQKEASQGGISA